MNNIKYIISSFVILSLLLSSCDHTRSEGDGHNHEKQETAHSGNDGNSQGEGDEEHRVGLFLTKDQAKTIGLEFGDLSSIKVNDFVKATGTLGLPPNAYSSVSAKTNGIIKGTTKFVEGNYIKKGAIIAYLENADLIITQQDYLETIRVK